MIQISGARSITGERMDLTYASQEHVTLDATGLTIFPGLIDPHVHFRTPGLQHKEDWQTGAAAAIAGGYTTVFDMPNTLPPTVTETLLQEKKKLINHQLQAVGIPLRYELFFGADKNHLSELHKITHQVIGIKIFMGCSTGNLVIDDDESLHAVFAIAATQNLLVAVHAEDEDMINVRKKQYQSSKQYHDHSRIRDVDVACRAVEKAILLSKIYGTRLYILHVSSAAEIQLIRQAKAAGLPVYAETTPHHLFLNESAYDTLQGKAVVNPPLRTADHQAALFSAIQEGIIDTIGSDHAPHLLAEKALPYGQCPSGMPGIETTLPLLLTAFHTKQLSLAQIISLTYTKPREIFGLAENDDKVLVDLEHTQSVDPTHLKTKSGWSSFTGRLLTGWPKYVLMQGRLFNVACEIFS